jgi:hypothetical protein
VKEYDMADEAAEVVVVTQAVRDEAKRWAEQSDAMGILVREVDALDLFQSAFWLGLPTMLDAAVYSNAYNAFQNFMLTILRGAVVEFGQLGQALTKIANEYDRLDKVGELNLNKIYNSAASLKPTGISMAAAVTGGSGGPGGTGAGAPSAPAPQPPVTTTSATSATSGAQEPPATTIPTPTPGATTPTTPTAPEAPVSAAAPVSPASPVAPEAPVTTSTVPSAPTAPIVPTVPSVQSAPPVAQTPASPEVAPAVQQSPIYPPASPTGIPTVQDAGWFPQTAGSSAGAGDGRLTIAVGDSDGDGDYEVKVDIPQSQLDKDIKIGINTKIGDEEITGKFDINV